MNTSEHPACSAAKAQARADYADFDEFRARLLAEEPDRFLVAVNFWKVPSRLIPNPIAFYAVTCDCSSAHVVPSEEAEKYGYRPHLRK